jgi:hypothetical protein
MATPPANGVPLWLKLLYTAFMAVLVPIYWHAYGPTNFLYFCDVALFLTLGALWLGDRTLASTAAVGILVPQTIWIADFLCELAGFQLTGMTSYMFDDKIPLFTRGLSFFHFWLPLFLVWLVWSMGYDRRAFWTWTILATIILPVCYYLLPPPPAPPDNPNLPVNVNYVFGPGEKKKQEWMHPDLFFYGLCLALPLVSTLPGHLFLGWLGKKQAPIS